jgi:lipid A disaccharide synthetase
MKALYKEDVDANIRFWGGDLMQKAGGTLVKHYRELAFMGFVEVLFNLKTILGNIKICKMILPNSNLMSLFLLTILALICVLQNGQKRKASQHTITYRPKYGLGRKSHH